MAGWQSDPIVDSGSTSAPAWASDPVVGQTDPQNHGATAGSVINNIAAGTNKFTSALLGAPVDITTFGINKGIGAVNWVSRQLGGDDLASPIVDPFGGSQSIRNAQGAIYGGSPDQVVPHNAIERISQGAGFGLAASLIPGSAALALPARASALVTEAVGAPTVGNALLGTVAGGSGEAASEVVPDKYKPLANLIGGLAGGGLVAGATALGGAAVKAAGDYLAPLTEAGRQNIAGRTLLNAATDPQAVRASLADGADEIIPGSVPTTAQQTGDMGLLSLERSVRTNAPDQFQARAAEQNAARTGAMKGVETAGDPSAVTKLMRSQLDDIEAQTNATVTAARSNADNAGAAIGGNQPLEAYGSNLRDAAVTAETAARKQERGLWNAVDPDGSLALDVTPVRDAAQNTMADMTASAKPMSAAEQQIFGAASKYADVMPFKDLTDLRSNLSDAMREELRSNGRTQTYGRLSSLRGAVEDAINTAVERQAQQEASAVAQGTMAPDATMASRLQQQAQEWQNQRAAEARAGQSAGENFESAAATGTGGMSSAFGASSSLGQRSGIPPGDQGVQTPITPNFDEAAAARLAAASAATKERASTFGAQTPAGAVTRNFEGRDTYRLSDSSVPARVFHPGPKGFEDVNQFRQAVGDENALPVLSDYAAMSLRRAAARPDGSLDPAKIAMWQRQHSEAMRAFPELQTKFATAADAERMVMDATATRKATLDLFNRQTAAKLLNLQAPEDVTRTIGGMFGTQNSATQFRELAQTVKNSPEARAGIRRSIVDYMNNHFIGNTEAGTTGLGQIKSDQFQTFVRQNKAALQSFFTDSELDLMQALAADLQRANRSMTAVKIPGQSNTAQDTAALRRNDLQSTVLQRIVTGGAGAAAGTVAAGPIGGALGALGATVVGAMRDAGLRKVDDLVTQAMLDPVLARALLRRVSANDAGESPFTTLSRRLRMISVIGSQSSENQRRRAGAK